uniref:Uncharacterized protein n=1 Tax=Anguilla anguilla TaxID=7936 RepID=A0A0E9R4Y3_ANGAN
MKFRGSASSSAWTVWVSTVGRQTFQ